MLSRIILIIIFAVLPRFAQRSEFMNKLQNTLLCLLSLFPFFARADAPPYLVNPGDVLQVFVWNEKELTQEVLVRPDGAISLPLAGQVSAGGLSVPQIEQSLTDALSKYMNDKPAVTVAIKETRGYSVYVLGKVNKAGLFPINQPTDVVQALAMAGGLTPFAAENSIHILRRDKSGEQKAIPFRYSDVKAGEELQTNILLQSGDVIVVP
jgi:polysaccharide biosynthesis/export protein